MTNFQAQLNAFIFILHTNLSTQRGWSEFKYIVQYIAVTRKFQFTIVKYLPRQAVILRAKLDALL